MATPLGSVTVFRLPKVSYPNCQEWPSGDVLRNRSAAKPSARVAYSNFAACAGYEPVPQVVAGSGGVLPFSLMDSASSFHSG
ncbi:hypothetical protein SGLAM104S_04123 [Streptomyces glaucescens]